VRNSRCDENLCFEHRGETGPRYAGTKIVKRGKMETQGNIIQTAEKAPAVTLSNVALRVALWVLYGGAAAEMVYGSKTIEEGMATPLAGCSSRHAN
jgi:hypothetical protein